MSHLPRILLFCVLISAFGCSNDFGAGADADAAMTDAMLPPDGAPDLPDGAPAGDAGSPDAAPDAAPLPPLPCDRGFSVPSSIGDDAAFEVSYTHRTGYAFVDLLVSGAGTPSAAWAGLSGDGPFTWSYTISGHAAGVLDLTFTADSGATTVATCRVRVQARGATDGGVADGAVPDGAAPDGGPPPMVSDNRFGIGLVGPGNTAQLDLTADLTGPGGYIKLIFVGVRPGMTGPNPEWVDIIRGAYARDLVPVIRFAPDWGDRRVRNQSDAGSDGLRYSGLAASYAAIVGGLPLRDGWPFYVEVHNEPNLCYEWACDPGVFDSDRITSARIAEEYASLLRDVADALHAMGDARVQVVNAGLAPGGVRWCECVGTGEGAFEGGNTSREFLSQMSDAVPGIFDRIDAFASHSYPAEGEGWGFFVPYDRSGTGLRYFETELSTIGRPDIGVLMTETGWPTTFGGTGYASREQVASWTRSAYENVWLTHPNILGIMPFILQDPGAWDGFAWVRGDGSAYPVFDEIRALRCGLISGRCP